MTTSSVPWEYVRDHRRKPHVHPLATPEGHVLTTCEPDDHPWQRGLWFSIKFVDGDNFWEELPPYGVLRHVDDEAVQWVRPDRETVALTERRRLRHHHLGPDAYAIDWESELVAPADTVLDRTEYTTWGGYGGLSFRGRHDWTDTELRLAEGSTADRAVAVESRWLDLTGTLDGAAVGISFLDHPANPRHPVPWYASTVAGPGYGEGWANFVNAAFLFHEPLTLEAGVPLTLRYRVVVHDGSADHERVDRWWHDWTRRP